MQYSYKILLFLSFFYQIFSYISLKDFSQSIKNEDMKFLLNNNPSNTLPINHNNSNNISYWNVITEYYKNEKSWLYQIWFGDDDYYGDGDDYGGGDDYYFSYDYWMTEPVLDQPILTTTTTITTPNLQKNRFLRSNIPSKTTISSLLLHDILTHQLSWMLLGFSCGVLAFIVLVGKYYQQQ